MVGQLATGGGANVTEVRREVDSGCRRRMHGEVADTFPQEKQQHD